jgi:cell division protein FtsI/penicillin-binding protein 2
MNKDRMLQMAARNLKKARKALTINCSRQGITEEERNNLADNVRFAEVVYDLIASHA